MHPGRDKKLFSSENLTISWRRNKSVLSFEGEKVDGLKKDLCDMLLERGEYNNNSDINPNHNYSGKDFDIYNEINSLKSDQSINRELIQSLSNSISHFTEVISNLQDSVYKKSEDFVDISNSPKGKAAEYRVNNLNDLHMNTPLESLRSTIMDNHDSINSLSGSPVSPNEVHVLSTENNKDIATVDSSTTTNKQAKNDKLAYAKVVASKPALNPTNENTSKPQQKDNAMNNNSRISDDEAFTAIDQSCEKTSHHDLVPLAKSINHSQEELTLTKVVFPVRNNSEQSKVGELSHEGRNLNILSATSNTEQLHKSASTNVNKKIVETKPKAL